MRRLHELLSGVLRIPLDRVTPALSMEQTVEWDSMKHIELITTIEEAYAIDLTGEEIAEMTSVRAIEEVLVRRGIGDAAP
jgi:acyl carrier protein